MSRISNTEAGQQISHVGAHAALATSIVTPSTAITPPAVDGVVISCHEGEVPAFVDAEMDRLYGNIHCSLAHLKTYDGFNTITHTYVARRQQDVVAIFLFCIDRHEVRVLNEGMHLDDTETARFARHVFSSYPAVDLISFHAVQSGLRKLPYPLQGHVCTADIVLPLPDSADAYLASLGKNTRRNIRRYMDKLKRSFPSFRYDVYEKDAVNEQHVRDIIQLNRTRISGKNKTFGIDSEVDRIVTLTKRCGMVGVVIIDGRVCAGAVGYLAGKNYFFKVIAHDPAYNAFSAGILCCYLTICACIERGCSEYNFMWNEYEYKFALGAKSRELRHVTIYRSRLSMLLHWRKALSVAMDGYRYQASSLLEKGQRPDQLSPGQQRVFRLLDRLRRLKQAAAGKRRPQAG